jgi:xylan 1,4-beta-xylosidase
MIGLERYDDKIGMKFTTRVVLLACSALLAPAAWPDAGLRKITVDARTQVGTLRSLSGVNGSPAPGMHKPPYFKFGGGNMPENVDASAGYRMAGIDLVRTHDGYGPGDIDAKFESDAAPGGGLISAKRDGLVIFRHSQADPDDPASYHFGPTDAQVGAIRKIGAQVLFRLGRSEGADPRPPKDFARYADIAKHIVLHYNRGWANGYHYGIRYWEVWNEPDLGKVFWAGAADQYFDLYARIARAVKEADPQALVGGPAIARPNDDTPYRDAFMDYVRSNKVPLDFYSWHWYATDSEDPMDFVRIARDVRARLDKHGLTKTLSILSEWNYGLEDHPPSPLTRASFLTSAIIYMQDAPIDAATLYRADNVFGTGGATPDEVGAALIALGKMHDTPIRLKSEGADLDGFAVEAGRSKDGTTLRVLVSNYQIPAKMRGPRGTDDTLHVPPVFDVRLLSRRTTSYADNGGFELNVDGLPPAPGYVVERCLISAEKAGRSGSSASAGAAGRGDRGATAAVEQPAGAPTLRPRKGSGPTLALKETLGPPGVELITVHAGHEQALEGGEAGIRHCTAVFLPSPSETADRHE